MRTNLIIGIILTCFVALSIIVRFVIPWDDVMGQGEVRFTEVDSYYFMRSVDCIKAGNSGLTERDPLLNFPVPNSGTFDEVIAMNGSGSYSLVDQHSMQPMLAFTVYNISRLTGVNVDIIGAFIPAVAGILLLIPVFVICLYLFGKWQAVFGTVLVSIMPGELLSRTSLGYLDNHALEILFSAFVLMFLVMAIKNNWLWSIQAGISLGLYYLIWNGALLFSGILVLWVIVQSIIYHKEKQYGEINKLNLISTWSMSIACMIYIAVNSSTITYVIIYAMMVAILFIINVLFNLMKNTKTVYYALSLIGTGIAFISLGYLIKSTLITSIIYNLLGISGSSVISGMQTITFQSAWAYYGIALYAGIAGFILFYVRNWKTQSGNLFLVWFVIFFVFSVIWVRFNYYMAVGMAIFTAYLCVEGFKLFKSNWIKQWSMGFMVVFFLLVPLSVQSIKLADHHPYMPSKAWVEALDYLKSKTYLLKSKTYLSYSVTSLPDKDPDYYWIKYENFVSAGSEKPSYCVLSLWDYGYWIVREGHQAVFCSPTGSGSQSTAIKLLTSAIYPLKSLQDSNVRYIVIDRSMVGDKYGKLRDHTELKDSFMYKLWTSEVQGIKLVFESKSKYLKESEVKIYECSY